MLTLEYAKLEKSCNDTIAAIKTKGVSKAEMDALDNNILPLFSIAADILENTSKLDSNDVKLYSEIISILDIDKPITDIKNKTLTEIDPSLIDNLNTIKDIHRLLTNTLSIEIEPLVPKTSPKPR